MIEALVVTSSETVGRGLQRLLESDGDIEVVATLATVDALDGALAHHAQAAVVLGPGARPSTDQWQRIIRRNGSSRAIVLAAVPGRHRHPRGVVEVPMELSGDGLRQAVRTCASR
jgi:DNA-binding NarL/FixJ family response regulator